MHTNPWHLAWLITLTSAMPLAEANTPHSFSANEIARLNWGNGAKQIALDKAPANNFGPQRLLIDEAGTGLYLLDATNQRIWLFNTTLNQFSSIRLPSKQADDFCVLDNGEHFYLLLSQKVVLINNKAQQLTDYAIKDNIRPIGIQCHEKRGLIIQAFDGNAYRHNDDTPLEFQAMVRGGYTLHALRNNASEGTILLHHEETNIGKDILVVSRNGELATFNLIGVDNNENTYLSVEEVATKGSAPRRFLRKYTPDGQLVAEAELAYSLYAYTFQDLVVTPTGDVFQIVPHKTHLKVVKWRLSTDNTRSAASRGLSLSYTETQADDFEPSEAAVEGIIKDKSAETRRTQAVSRQQILAMAKAYVNKGFYVDYANITSGRQYLGGKIVKTPISTPGWYRGVPYKWCGFNSLSSFQNGLTQGKKAGDKCTKCGGRSCGSRQAVGVDCSGFVSRVWGLTRKYGTSQLPKISDRLRSKSQLRPGDILNKVGHVRLFSHRDAAGRFCVYEASSKDWKVSKRCYRAYQLKNYRPYRYKRVLSQGGSGFTTTQKRPTRFLIYGTRRIAEGQSRTYQAKVFYSDGSRRDVTHRASWREKSRYAYFRGATLYTKRVNRKKSVYIKASYAEKGKILKAGVAVTIRNTSARN